MKNEKKYILNLNKVLLSDLELVEGIDTISVTPDSMLKTIKAIAKIENK